MSESESESQSQSSPQQRGFSSEFLPKRSYNHPAPPHEYEYRIDIEAFSDSPTAHDIYAYLLDRIRRRGFNIKNVCRICHNWDNRQQSLLRNPDQIIEKPYSKPGAELASDGCSGCFFSYLDEAEPTDPNLMPDADADELEARIKVVRKHLRNLWGETPMNPVLLARTEQHLARLEKILYGDQ